MYKTPNDIERDFFAMVKGSKLGQEIEGSVYRSNMRPPLSEGEDIVVRFLTGVDSQIQTGVVQVNVYTVSVQTADGRSVDDKARIGTLMDLFYDMILHDEPDYDYVIETDGSPRVNYDTDARQYVLNCRVRYRYLDINE